MGNCWGDLLSTSEELLIPSAQPDRNFLIFNLRNYYNLNVQPRLDRIKVVGSDSEVSEAQKCVSIFMQYDDSILVPTSRECVTIFKVPDIVRHFQKRFGIFIAVKEPVNLYLKGEVIAVEQFKSQVDALKANCRPSQASMNGIQYDRLRRLCREFSVDPLKLPSSPSIRIALLTYFSALSNLRHRMSASSNSQCRNDSFRTSVVQESLRKENPANLRLVVIDGSNVAFAHGNNGRFSPEGIQLAIDFFTKRGHKNVVAMVPGFRRAVGGKLFERLEKEDHLIYTPSRRLNDRQQVSDDDRLILELAAKENGVVVSNDQYRDYLYEFRDVIERRLLPFVIRGNFFTIPNDPHGRDGPSLAECLRLP